MKLKDILTKEMYEKYGDMDVYNDWTDDIAPAWCGTLLTEYGATVYPALELEACVVDNSDDDHYILVFINDLPDGEDERAWDEVVALFDDMAGYIGESDYKKRFIDDWDLSIPKGRPDEDVLERIEKLEYIVGVLEGRLSRAIGCIVSPLPEGKEEALRYIGLSDKEIHDWLD